MLRHPDASLLWPANLVVAEAPGWRPVPAAHGIGELVPAQRSHELESAALERFIERKLVVGLARQCPFGTDVIGWIEIAGRKPTRRPLDQERSAARGVACVTVTHDLNLALTYATRSIVLADGRVALDVPVDEAARRPDWLELFSARLTLLTAASGRTWVSYS